MNLNIHLRRPKWKGKMPSLVMQTGVANGKFEQRFEEASVVHCVFFTKVNVK